MPNFSESLTVRILGDSSQLQQELLDVTRSVTDLQNRFAQLGEVNRIIDQSSGRLSALVRPLQQISRIVERIISQVQTLSRTPVTLNVTPALNSLAQLSRAIARIAAQIRSIPPIAPRLPGIPGGFFQPRRPIRRFADGGVVQGPAGPDRVPALLTAGEFIIRAPAAHRLGESFLDALNRNASSRITARPAVSPTAAAVEQSTVNNFGGVSIHVGQASDVNSIVRDLRFQGAQLRNRRG